MPEQAFVRLLVVDRDAAADDPLADDGQYIAEGLGLEHAVLTGHDPVRVRGIEAHDRIVVPVELDRELRFVAVAERLVGAAHGEDLGVEVPDAFEGVRDAPVFVPEFRLIRHVPVTAPAALRRDRTVRFDAVGRRREDLEGLADGVVLFRLDDMTKDGVAHRGVRHENGHAVVPSDAAALRRHGIDGQGDFVVFSEHMVRPFSGGLPAVR